MAYVDKNLHSIKKPLPITTRLMPMNAIVISHLYYLTKFLNASTKISNNSLKKQKNWAVKTCRNRLNTNFYQI